MVMSLMEILRVPSGQTAIATNGKRNPEPVRDASKRLNSARIKDLSYLLTMRRISALWQHVQTTRHKIDLTPLSCPRNCAGSLPCLQSIPTEMLVRLCRYLLGVPPLVYSYNFHNVSRELTIYTDTDVAGCHRTRRSTSGGALMRGEHMLQCYSQTQATVCLSSGEAELQGIGKGASKSLGLKCIATVWASLWTSAS